MLNRSPIIFLFPRNYFLIIFPSLPRIEYNRISATRITLFPPSDRWSGVSRRVRVGGGGQDRTIATVVESGSSYRSSRCCSQVRPAIATTFLHLSRNCSQVVLAFDNAVTISSSRDNISLSVENSGICFDRVPSTFAREISVWKNCAMHARYFESILFRNIIFDFRSSYSSRYDFHRSLEFGKSLRHSLFSRNEKCIRTRTCGEMLYR